MQFVRTNPLFFHASPNDQFEIAVLHSMSAVLGMPIPIPMYVSQECNCRLPISPHPESIRRSSIQCDEVDYADVSDACIDDT